MTPVSPPVPTPRLSGSFIDIHVINLATCVTQRCI